MNTKLITLITLSLLLCVLLSAVSCGKEVQEPSEETKRPAASDTLPSDESTNKAPDTTDDNSDTTPDTEKDTTAEGGDTESGDTDEDVTVGDGTVEDPSIQTPDMPLLSVKEDLILGITALDKPADSDVIDSYSDFVSLYGTVEGIDEAFFETHVLRLVHTAQSSSSTRYAIDSISMVDGTLKIEIIEQLAAISTRDLRYQYVFAAVEKDMVHTPVEVNVTSVQLT